MSRAHAISRDVSATSIANILLTKLEFAELLLDSPLSPHTEEYLRGYADAVELATDLVADYPENDGHKANLERYKVD